MVRKHVCTAWRRYRSEWRMHLGVGSELASMYALRSGCTWAWAINHHLRACVHGVADALGRGFLPSTSTRAAWRMRLGVGSHHLRAYAHCVVDALVRALRGGCTWASTLTICDHQLLQSAIMRAPPARVCALSGGAWALTICEHVRTAWRILCGGCTWLSALTIREHACTGASVVTICEHACTASQMRLIKREFIPSASMCALRGGCTWA